MRKKKKDIENRGKKTIDSWICIENNSLPFNDYVKCRELDMTVEITHNGGVFDELKGFCKNTT